MARAALDVLHLDQLEVPLDRDRYLCVLAGELSGALQDIVGREEAHGFVSLVGQRMGRDIGRLYRRALGVTRLTKEQLAQVLVDIEGRIGGDFSVVALDEERIVLRNRACPFGAQVHGRPAMCMMTSNVLGSIAADNLGYARVELQETIAAGDGGCTIVIHLQPNHPASGREYVRGPDDS
jgi:predicted ArsR family transcriptional regulator